MKHAFVFILFFLIGIIIVVSYKLIAKSPGKPINNIISTISKPKFTIEEAPSESVRGIITSMTGNVRWQSRIATESAKINSLITLQQGEAIQTEETGNANTEFPSEALIRIDPKTEIDFIQTLPTSFVLNIASGSATVKKLSATPLSIRAMHLLVRQNSGEVNIGIDETGLINLNIVSGSVTLAYNDLNLNSHVLDISEGQKASFNDLTRVLNF